MAFSSTDLSNVETAIITLATRAACETEIGGRRVLYKRSDLPYLLQLKAAIESDVANAADDGGLALIKPGGSK